MELIVGDDGDASGTADIQPPAMTAPPNGAPTTNHNSVIGRSRQRQFIKLIYSHEFGAPPAGRGGGRQRVRWPAGSLATRGSGSFSSCRPPDRPPGTGFSQFYGSGY